jgi:hypothetical protein
VMVGDTHQLPAVESGKPFSLIQQVVETKEMVEIRRQKDDTLKQAVQNTIKKDFRAAFETLEASIIEINEKTHPPAIHESQDKSAEVIHTEIRHKRLDALVKDYFSFPKAQHDSIQIITPGHDDKALVNAKVREHYKLNGTFQKDGDTLCTILIAKSLTQVERSHVTNFKVGEVLRFGRSLPSGIKAGDYLTISEINQQDNVLTLKNRQGNIIAWQIPAFDKTRSSDIEVFKKDIRALQAGDTIRWSRSDKKQECFSTEPAKVLSVNKDNITVELANQKEKSFNPQDPSTQHWDHGYAATVYAVQADTKSIVLAHLESHRKNLTSQPAFLVALTRAVNTFRLYTDDREVLLQQIERNHGKKYSSLEVIEDCQQNPLSRMKKEPLLLPDIKTIEQAINISNHHQRGTLNQTSSRDPISSISDRQISQLLQHIDRSSHIPEPTRQSHLIREVEQEM